MTIFHKAPGTFPRRRVRTMTTGLLLLFAFCSLALADDPIFRVARISLVEGEVSYQQGKDSGETGKEWFDATLNLPLEEKDQLYSGSDGRAEIQLSGRNVVRIDHDTNLRFTQFNTGAIQLALPIGSAYFRIDSLDKRKFDVVDANDPGIDDPVYFEIDTPTVAVTLAEEGVYRINVRDDGSTEVIVREGEAEVYNKEIDTVVVKKDRRLVVEGRGDLHQISGLQDKDDWDLWNDARDKGFPSSLASSGSSEYIPEAVPGAYDLDNYGEWIDTEEYGRMWSPRGVDADWAPYRDGYWRWFPSYGWTWVSSEPWGWTPYHYGRWAYVRDRWCWAPLINVNIVNINTRPRYDWRWRPHHVAFFGWGGDYGRGYRDGYYNGYWKGFRDGRYGYLGWCPLSPHDRHYGPRDKAPRLEELRNFRARGGVSGMDARRFTGGRALVSRSLLNAPVPPRGEARGEKGFAAMAFVRNDDLKPLQRVAPTRSDAVARGRFARRIEAPIVFRRTPGGPLPGPRPNRDGRNRDDRERREGLN
ncbi:MAG TPA: FecR family protein, partial [Blastocatellia bacterium]